MQEEYLVEEAPEARFLTLPWLLNSEDCAMVFL